MGYVLPHSHLFNQWSVHPSVIELTLGHAIYIHQLSAHLPISVSIYLSVTSSCQLCLTHSITSLYHIWCVCMCVNDIDFLWNCEAALMQLTPTVFYLLLVIFFPCVHFNAFIIPPAKYILIICSAKRHIVSFFFSFSHEVRTGVIYLNIGISLLICNKPNMQDFDILRRNGADNTRFW